MAVMPKQAGLPPALARRYGEYQPAAPRRASSPDSVERLEEACPGNADLFPERLDVLVRADLLAEQGRMAPLLRQDVAARGDTSDWSHPRKPRSLGVPVWHARCCGTLWPCGATIRPRRDMDQ